MMGIAALIQSGGRGAAEALTARARLKRNESFALLLLVLGAFALAARHIETPGLQYDELLFINAAKGGMGSDLFIHARIGGIPILVMSYMGALKAWIYHPLLIAFPMGAATVRLPAVALGISGAVLLVAGLGRLFGRRAALLAAPVVLLDPTMLMQSRIDWGPSALMFFFRGLLFYSIASWVATRRVSWLFCGLAAALLGVFDKLNFIWLAYAMLGSFLAFYWRECWTAARRARVPYGLLGAIVAISVGEATYRAVSVARSLPAGGPSDFAIHAGRVLRLLALTVCGDGARDFVCGTGFAESGPILAAWMLVAAFGGYVAFRNRIWTCPAALFVFASLVGTVALMLVTPTTEGVHHAALIGGMPQAVFISFACAGADGARLSRWARVATCVAVLGLAGLFAASAFRTVDLFQRPQNMSWDMANQRAAEFAAKTGEVCISGDWGLSTQLIAFGRAPQEVLDAWEVLGSRGGAEFYVKTMDAARTYEVITHDPSVEYFKGGGNRLIASLETDGWSVGAARAFKAWDGKDLVFVYTVRHA
jgi:Dolichyl-phosphate-mannose-protein mannosyltransferase